MGTPMLFFTSNKPTCPQQLSARQLHNLPSTEMHIPQYCIADY